MAYTPKTSNYSAQKPAETAQPAKAAINSDPNKVRIEGSLHVTAAGEKKGERLCNLFKNEKDGKTWLSGKAEDGTRFTIFLNT
jgi:hypothetical protein